MDNICIVSLNVRGARDDNKRKEIFSFCRDYKADVVCLQETHSTIEIEKIWAAQWGGKIFFSHGTGQARGVCILVRKNFDAEIEFIDKDGAGRRIVVQIKKDGVSLLLGNVYAPNTDEPAFFVDTFKQCTGENAEIILIGDFNLVLDPKIDRKNGKEYNPKARQNLIENMDNFDLVDVWHIENPENRTYSWFKDHKSMEEVESTLLWLHKH